MNWLDYTILGFIAIFVYRGFRKGFITRVLGLVGVIFGIWLGVKHNLKVAQILKDIGISAEFSTYLAMFIIFVACILTATLLAKFLRNVSIFVELIDNLLGAILGFLEGLLIIGILFIFLGYLNFPSEKVRDSSKFYKPVVKATVGIYDFIEKNFGSKIKFKDGRRIIVNLSRSLIKDENGEILGSIAIVKDVTKVKELEKQIQHSDKLALIGQIAAGIAHEIGTPLNVISGNAEYIMMEMGENNPYKEELETIISQAERIANLIKQLLEFARPKKPNYTKINVNHEISHVVELLKHQFEKSNIKLNLKFSENIPDIYADCSQIHQVFLNIIMNAIQAINQNGLIEIETFLRDGYVNIKFKDNGIGILPEHIDKIFEPFLQLRKPGKVRDLDLQ